MSEHKSPCAIRKDNDNEVFKAAKIFESKVKTKVRRSFDGSKNSKSLGQVSA